MNQAQVNVGASDGLTDQQLIRLGATVEQITAIPPAFRPAAVHAPAGHAAQAHANVHVATAPVPPPPPQILMAQQAQQPVAQFMGAAFPVVVGNKFFTLLDMALWKYIAMTVLATLLITLLTFAAFGGWFVKGGASITTPPAVSAPVAAAAPQVIKIDPIKITVDVTGVQPGKP